MREVKKGELPFIRRGLRKYNRNTLCCITYTLFFSCVLFFPSFVLLYCRSIFRTHFTEFVRMFSFHSLSRTHTHSLIHSPSAFSAFILFSFSTFFPYFFTYFLSPPPSTVLYIFHVEFRSIFHFYFRNEMIGKCGNKKFMHEIFIHKLMLIFALQLSTVYAMYARTK